MSIYNTSFYFSINKKYAQETLSEIYSIFLIKIQRNFLKVLRNSIID